MKKSFYYGAAVAALIMPSAVFAQSTGSIDFSDEIVVTGASVDKGVAGVLTPDTAKAKAVLTQEFLARQAPGQSVNDIINQLPGVSFQNNDPFGSAGGTMTIRGFDDTRISQTFDGIPLNDSGGYSIYSNQQLDPELIDQVNVNLGSTDVDSPTASASGSTVNYRTRTPSEEFGVKLVGSAGEYGFFRVFGLVDTGTFTKFGTRAFFSASHAENDTVFNNIGKIDKQQYNARVYQPIGSNGDFVSVAGHYNENRNNFFGSVRLRRDANLGVPDRFPLTKDERFYEFEKCEAPAGTAGVADAAGSCGTAFDYRYNPSNTGNIRGSSRFTLTDGLILTVDPSYQYTKANGGGTVDAREFAATGSGPTVGYIGGKPYFGGVDLNGDGDTLDTVNVLAPSQTQTHRYGVIASLRYDINDNHTIRAAYTFDRARHRQTGETGLLYRANGVPHDVFPVNNPLLDVNGYALQKRDRLSYAILNQASGEYRGKFFDALTVTAGVRIPFFKRDLMNNCFTTSVTGFVDCFGGNAAADDAYAAAKPTVQGPQRRVFKYDDVLPNFGLVYDFASRWSAFASYSKGVQVPGTDNLYNSFFYAADTDQANPTPETTDNFDLGLRYRAGKVQAQATLWYTKYKDRLAAAYDPELDRNIYRNLGTVEKYGIDASISYQPIQDLSIYVFGSYLESEIQDNVQTGVSNGAPVFAQTAGKRESGAPVYTLGGRIQGKLGPVELGVQAKRTGKRYINDENVVLPAWGSATAPAYTLVDLDMRVPLEFVGLNDKTYFQFNLSNVFDKLYVGGFDGNLNNSSVPFVQIGAPRTFMGSLVVGF